MDLFALDGNTLKVYLGLVVGCTPHGIYPHTDRALRQKVQLSRNTVRQALRHLKQDGLVGKTAEGWWVRRAPWAGLPFSQAADEPALKGVSRSHPSIPNRGLDVDPPAPDGVSRGSTSDPSNGRTPIPRSKLDPSSSCQGSEFDPPAPDGVPPGSEFDPSSLDPGSSFDPGERSTRLEGSKLDPSNGRTRGHRSELDPSTPDTGSTADPRGPEEGQNLTPPAQAPTRTRTLWSSSVL